MRNGLIEEKGASHEGHAVLGPAEVKLPARVTWWLTPPRSCRRRFPRMPNKLVSFHRLKAIPMRWRIADSLLAENQRESQQRTRPRRANVAT